MLKKDEGQFDLLEHVVKGVHVEVRGPRGHRVLPRPLERINDAPPKARAKKSTKAKMSRKR